MDPKDRYKHLINARNFHYENFNKWMTYFYVAIGALFVGYYSIITSVKCLRMEEISISVLGFITSLLWYWSSKGYYHWNINFITLVNECEKNDLKLKDEERVYFVFANKKSQNDYINPISGANISTSKISILFAFIITVVWGVILADKLFGLDYWITICISIFITLTISAIIPRILLRSKNDHFPDLKIDQK